MRCLITGATGHIGYVLVRELYKRNYDISIFVLPSDDVSIFDEINVHTIRGDIRNTEQVNVAITNKDLVFHLAGIIDIGTTSKKKMWEVNVNGTNNVIKACREHKIKRLIYTSSVHAIPEPKTANTVIKETLDFSPEYVNGPYAKSKAKATANVLHYTNEGYDAVILQPSGVIGPFGYKLSNMSQMIYDCMNDRLKFYIDGAYNFVDVRDVVQGICAAAEIGRSGECYILSGEIISVKGIIDTISNEINSHRNLTKISYHLAYIFSIFLEWTYKLKQKKLLFTPYSISVLRSKCNFSNQKAKNELNFDPRPIKESILDTISWLRLHGHETHT